MQSHLENNDVKLDALSEPNASLIENNVTLPKDIFGSYSSYLLYEVASCKPALFLFLVIVISFSLIVIFNDRDNCVGFSIMVIVVSLLALIVVVGNTVARPTRNQNFKIKFLVEVIGRKPSGKPGRIKPDPILGAYVLKAVEVEKEAQREYWRKQFPDADLP
ncbi:uncharacterized protein SKDI_01G0830 [Saccharomyces kudriavzevii IFO 1802]|uniref:Uncharacterized protein n=1 Tax=Saccharomyces kudriavzevii (strain ATCC MYA-4449 / AS 2.2408 / CBS 8840 / NBRC 1802 / NCYC 2889) TaxID=226230 RepID=A0AA35JC52_SACK1|nr:uncharacterized protein SKDI_01G0830 [Saccharomyces kudriavzevii IFO 1802]CAI4054655.1 hypothetical protein SKDI_01G0830 [Saccharomyces kudriavzevii IFO 1802]